MKKVRIPFLLILCAVFTLCICALFLVRYSTGAGVDLNETPNNSALEDGKLNINTATQDDLCMLPGVGTSLSQKIVAYRSENGPFKAINDLMNVKGIGERLLSQLSDYITVGDQ